MVIDTYFTNTIIFYTKKINVDIIELTQNIKL